MTEETRIAVDAMGGDGGPSIIMPSIKDFLSTHNDVKIEVFGDENLIHKKTGLLIDPYFSSTKIKFSRIFFCICFSCNKFIIFPNFFTFM